MGVDLSHVYMVPQVRMLLGLTFVIVLMDSLETTVNSALINVSIRHVSMEVYVWMEVTTTSVTAWVVDSREYTVRPSCLFVGQSLVTMIQHVNYIFLNIILFVFPNFVGHGGTNLSCIRTCSTRERTVLLKVPPGSSSLHHGFWVLQGLCLLARYGVCISVSQKLIGFPNVALTN